MHVVRPWIAPDPNALRCGQGVGVYTIDAAAMPPLGVALELFWGQRYEGRVLHRNTHGNKPQTPVSKNHDHP